MYVSGELKFISISEDEESNRQGTKQEEKMQSTYTHETNGNKFSTNMPTDWLTKRLSASCPVCVCGVLQFTKPQFMH